jgi:hypothetical protein
MTFRLTAPATFLLLAALTASGCSGDDSTTSAAPIAAGVTTRDADGCTYDGVTRFDLGARVTFGFINESEVTEAGFAIHKVVEGTTEEDILNLGVWAVSNEETDVYPQYLPSGMDLGVEYSVTVTLDKPGLHALICFQQPEGRPHYANLFTVDA